MEQDTIANKQKPKRRDKKEIEEEKLTKELNKIQREVAASKNTKCEQYLYCYVGGNLPDGLGNEMTARFTERDISQQLIFSSTGTVSNHPLVSWKKKRIEAYLEEGKLNRTQTMELEGAFAIIIEGGELVGMIKSKKLMSFLEQRIDQLKAPNPQLTVIVNGKVTTRENVLNDLLFEAFETCRVQFRFVTTVEELSVLVAQMHRAIAKMEKKQEVDISSLPYAVTEKGMREGHNLVVDWWTRMLDGVHRFSEDQKRAIVEKFPNPFKLMDKLLKMTAGDAIYYLAEVKTDSGRRIGPVIAQKLYLMLTSQVGDEVIHSS